MGPFGGPRPPQAKPRLSAGVYERAFGIPNMAKRQGSRGKREDTQWVATTQRDVAAFFGVALPTIQLWVKHGMPGQRGFYDLPSIYRWLKSQETSDSDALERYRDEKAKIERLRRLEMERQLVSFAAILGYLTSFAKHFRELGEQLQREYGGEIVRLFNEKIDDALDELQRADGDSSGEDVLAMDGRRKSSR